MSNEMTESKNLTVISPVDELLGLPKSKFRTAVVVNTDKTLESLKKNLSQCVSDMLPVPADKLDMTITAHRNAVRSAAGTLGRSKKPITDKINTVTKDLKDEIQRFKSFENMSIEEIAKMQQETRKPLTEYEAELKRLEDEREQRIMEKIDGITEIGASLTGEEDKEEILSLYEAVDGIDIDKETFAEFQIQALDAKRAVKEQLDKAINELTIKERLKDEADARKEAEKQRKQSEAFARFNALPSEMMNKTADEVKEQIAKLEGFIPDPEKFGEYAKPIADQLPNTLAMLRMIVSNKSQQAKSETTTKGYAANQKISQSIEVPESLSKAFGDQGGATALEDVKTETAPELERVKAENGKRAKTLCQLEDVLKKISLGLTNREMISSEMADALLSVIESGRFEYLTVNYNL